MESLLLPSCLGCEFRPDRIFCYMPSDSLRVFDAIKTTGSFPRNTVLFSDVSVEQLARPGKKQ